MKIAAIQLDAVFAGVNANILKLSNLIQDSAANGAELILLPEFFTTAIGFSEKMFEAVIQNNTVEAQMLCWARYSYSL